MTWNPCTQIITHSKIKLSDPKSKYSAVINNPLQIKHEKTQADGCWVKEKTAADWILTCTTNQHQVIVELKGSNVDHGAKQITATAEALLDAGKIGKKIAGLIVCTQYPKNNTTIQRTSRQFALKFKGPIHAVTKSREFDLEKILEFPGPS